MLRSFAPDVVVGTGGYTTAAVLLAQRMLGGRIVIHEQNAVPGRTNLWLARIADRVCVSVEDSARFFPPGKAVVTGMPVRAEFAALPDKVDARRRLGLDEAAFTILVVGGSQGAKAINDLMIGAWPLIDDGHTQALHQVGARNIEEMKATALVFRELVPETEEAEVFRELVPETQGAEVFGELVPETQGAEVFGELVPETSYRIEAYVDMPMALAAADLVIGRSGASTIAEVTAAGLPSIVIPYPFAYANHQKLNADHLAAGGAAIVCEESMCTPELLAGLVCDLRSAPDRLAEMAAASRALGRPDAARRIAEVVLSIAGRQTPSPPGGRG
jgi:UDP-N-acetylglucosamine--N-acetylmuramyl-(pentapeptide) pyrophosphoryl-undecaprenol N-acetylglucosamine transferase